MEKSCTQDKVEVCFTLYETVAVSKKVKIAVFEKGYTT